MATLMAPSPAAPTLTPSTQTPSALLPVYKRAPIELVRGEGIRLYDTEGREYLDFTSGIAVNALGYGDEGLRNAINAAADGLIHVSNLFRTSPGEQLAQRLADLSFADRVFFCNSGVEANEGAFKFARRWARTVGSPAKHEIVGVRGSFHGRLFASLAATDRPAYRAPFRPLAGGVSIAERDLESLAGILAGETVAALVIEPIQGEGGVRVFDAGYLLELRALTRERRIALMFDEIQCGLGRTGHLFAYQRVNVVPDLMTLAKPIAGGLPMGAILMTEEIAATIQPGDHGSTFGGGPFVTSVASHVLDRVADPTLLESVRNGGDWLGETLRELTARTGRIRDVRGTGFIWGIDVHEPAADVIRRARDEGLLLVGAGDHTLRVLPPLVATRADLEEGLRRLERALG
ncbi:MAG TPA: acetylornithine transaminase [Gemmatimonadaceae bacterium]